MRLRWNMMRVKGISRMVLFASNVWGIKTKMDVKERIKVLEEKVSQLIAIVQKLVENLTGNKI